MNDAKQKFGTEDRDETEWKELLYDGKTNTLDYILGLP